MSADLVPFGKYKGQPVEVLAADKSYCEWLAGQEWFRTRFTAIHTLIVNNFAAPHETPEHNALQALFTDPRWRQRFIWVVGEGPAIWARLMKEAVQAVQHYQQHDVVRFRAAWSDAVERVQQGKLLPSGVEYPQSTCEQAEQFARHWAEWLARPPRPAVRCASCEFEVEGADVVLRGRLDPDPRLPEDLWQHTRTIPYGSGDDVLRALRNLSYHLDFRIECKPVMGADYPAVLRQMKSSSCDTLLLGAGGYTGTGATWDQVVEMFASAEITIVRLADLPVAEMTGGR
jgi:hypothetical protein